MRRWVRAPRSWPVRAWACVGAVVGGSAGPAGAGHVPAEAQSPDTVILVGPNIQVSRGEHPVVELDVAAHPTDPDRLVATGVAFGAGSSRAFVSEDGGGTWSPFLFPAQERRGGADPRVAYLPDGSMLFVALAPVPGVGRTSNELHVVRSPDGGRSWTAATTLADTGYDYPLLLPDPGSRTGGLLLVARAPADGAVVVQRSVDGGTSFGPPVTVVESSTNPLLLGHAVAVPGGGLVLPVLEVDAQTIRLLVTRSTDGVAFDAPVHLATFSQRDTLGAEAEPVPRRVGRGTHAVAWDAARRAVLLFWAGADGDDEVVEAVRSEDGGRTWSPPARVAGGLEGRAVHLMASVSRDGIVGVAWVEAAPGAPGKLVTRFAASLDGGRSFRDPVRVTSAAVEDLGPPRPSSWPTLHRIREGSTHLVSGPSQARFPTGGDYVGMTVDAAGRFHPVWADARTGDFQAWTATVTVGPRPARPAQPQGTPEDVRLRVERTEVSDSGEVAWISLVNAGPDTLWGPLAVETVPEEGGPGGGAAGGTLRIDYADAMGSAGMLPPGGVSEVRPLPLGRAGAAGAARSLELRVTGGETPGSPASAPQRRRATGSPPG